MNKGIYAIYDNKADTWMDPFYALNDATAKRTFADATNDERSMFNKHPTDFEMFHIGTWNDQKGTIKENETKQAMGMANAYKHEEELRAVK